MPISKKYLLFILLVLFCFTKWSNGQNRLVLNQNVYLTISNGANVVLDNASDNAITILGSGGNIVSEGELNVVKWNIGTSTGNYIIPFTTNTGTKIPLAVNIINAGVGGAGSVLFATYETITDSNTVYPSDVNNMGSGCSSNNSLFAVDRFWHIDAQNYTTKPTPSITFTYNDASNEIGGSNTIIETHLKAERFNPNTNTWETPQKLYGTNNANLNTVSAVAPLPSDFYKSWTLVDTGSMFITQTHTITLCQGDSIFLQGSYQYLSGTYYDTILVPAACDTSIISNVVFTIPPTVTVASHTDIACNSVNIGSATVAVTGGSGVLTYLWTNNVSTTTTAANLAAGLYTITVTDTIGCSDSVSVTITQPPPLVAQVSAPPACGSNNGTAQITSITGGAGSYAYSWSPTGSSNSSISGLSTGIYICTITDANNCTISDTAFVTVHPNPVITISSDTTINIGYSLPLQVSGAATYTWSPSSTLSCNNCANPSATPLEPTTYCVVALDSNNCGGNFCVNVDVNKECDVVVPKAFSPNNDGQNDFECIYGKCATSVYLAIYNRWGEKVFETTELSRCWDGTYNNTALNTAVFVYYLEATLIDGSKVKHQGNITLIK